MSQRAPQVDVLRPFLSAALISFAVSFVTHLLIRAVGLGPGETAERVVLGLVFVVSFVLVRLLTRRQPPTR